MPGDIVLFAGETWTAKAIRKCQTSRGEEPTEVNHVGIMVSDTHLVEALARIRLNPIQKYINNPEYKLYIFRINRLTQVERYLLAGWAKAQVGKWYAPLKITAHLGDWLLNLPFKTNARIFRRLIFTRSMLICSELVARGYWEILKYKFLNLDPEEVTPDDIFDHCFNNDKVTEIYSPE
jgi:hypothetical protein